uniref:LmrA/YxaF family transcription factor n=1 Tax=Microbispora cellulosiformans TaxID=2614688 RepID=UPI003851175C
MRARLETLGTDSAIQRVRGSALRGWERLVYDKPLRAGFREEDARDLATTVISTLEGAEVTAQVHRSEEPLRAAGRQLARLVDGTAPDPGTGRRLIAAVRGDVCSGRGGRIGHASGRRRIP